MSTVSRTCARALAIAAAVTLSAAAQTPPPQGRGTAPGGRGAPPPQGGGMLAAAGPADKPPVDSAAADRARPVYAAECINCHGTQARGTDEGPEPHAFADGAARSLRQPARPVPEEGTSDAERRRRRQR